MAESTTAPTGGPGRPPQILPWLVIHTVGRLSIFALATLVLWMVGLDFWSGALFGLLLSMPERSRMASCTWSSERCAIAQSVCASTSTRSTASRW